MNSCILRVLAIVPLKRWGNVPRAPKARGKKNSFFPGFSTLKSTPEMSVELLLYSLNERCVEQTRSQIALFARGASLKAEENAARAPKVRATKMLGLFRNYALKKHSKMLR